MGNSSSVRLPQECPVSLTWGFGRDKVLGLPLPHLWDPGERWSHPGTLSPFWVSLQTGPLSGFLRYRLDVVTLPAAASSCEETLSLHLSIYYLSIYLPIHSTLLSSTYLPIYPSVYLPSIYLSTNLPTHPSICPSTHIPIHPSVHLPTYPSIHPSIYPPTHPPIYLLINLATYLPIYLPIPWSFCPTPASLQTPLHLEPKIFPKQTRYVKK